MQPVGLLEASVTEKYPMQLSSEFLGVPHVYDLRVIIYQTWHDCS